MSNDPLSKLRVVIAKAAQERDERRQKIRDGQTAKDRQREEARALWAERKEDLSSIVDTIDGLLKEHGYGGLAIVGFDSKHSDIDRVLLEFEHGIRNHSKVLLCVTSWGEFTCAVGAVYDEAVKIKIPIEQLSEDRLKGALAQAVEECLVSSKGS